MNAFNTLGILFIFSLLSVACGNSNDTDDAHMNDGGKTGLPAESGDIRPSVKSLEFYYYDSYAQVSVDGSYWEVSAILDTDGVVLAQSDDGICSWDWLTASRTDDGELLVQTGTNYLTENVCLILELSHENDKCLLKIHKGPYDELFHDPDSMIDGYYGFGGIIKFAVKWLTFEPDGGTIILSAKADKWIIGNNALWEEDPNVYNDYGWFEYQKIGLHGLMITVDKNENDSRLGNIMATTFISGADIAVYQKAAE